jgi:hypothetical protein
MKVSQIRDEIIPDPTVGAKMDCKLKFCGTCHSVKHSHSLVSAGSENGVPILGNSI